MSAYAINHNDWVAFDRDGYQINASVEVRRTEDGLVRIGRSLYREEELRITEDRIDSLAGGWYLAR